MSQVNGKFVKIGVALPMRNVDPPKEFWRSFSKMEKPFDWTWLEPAYPTEYADSIDETRNALVEEAFKSDCTHLLCMDTDQTYPHDFISRLFAHNLPIVSALVMSRHPPFGPFLKRQDIFGKYQSIPDGEWRNGGLVEVDGTGIAACSLINMDVFCDVPHPWFETIRIQPKDGKPGKIIGEDYSFCQKAKAAGYKIMVDCSIEVGHLTTLTITKNFHFLWKRLQELAEK